MIEQLPKGKFVIVVGRTQQQDLSGCCTRQVPTIFILEANASGVPERREYHLEPSDAKRIGELLVSVSDPEFKLDLKPISNDELIRMAQRPPL